MSILLKQICLFFLLTTILFGCGGSEDSNPPETNGTASTAEFTGDFLSWTGSDDASHYFTLVRVNGQTGTVTTIGGSNFFTGLAYGADGFLYGVSDDLHIINPANGATTKVGDLTYSGSTIIMSEATFSPDGKLFVIENGGNRVFTVDLTTGELTLVGTINPLTIAMSLEFSTSGTLYTSFVNLYTLNASDMTTITTAGSTGGVYISELASGSDGILYGKDVFPSTNIYSLNQSIGLATVVTPVSSISLVSFVAERKTTAYTVPQIQTSVVNGPSSSTQDIESLLTMEKEIRDHYFNSK